MYAPKFQSWLTDEERFSMALDYKLNVMADEALAEIKQMAKDAMPKEPPIEENLAEKQYELMRGLLSPSQEHWYSQISIAAQTQYPTAHLGAYGAAPPAQWPWG